MYLDAPPARPVLVYGYIATALTLWTPVNAGAAG